MPQQNAYRADNADQLRKLALFIRSMPFIPQTRLMASVYGSAEPLMLTDFKMRWIVSCTAWWSGLSKEIVWLALFRERKAKLLKASVDGLIDHMLNGKEVNVAGGFNQQEIDRLAWQSHLLDYKHSRGYLT